MISFNDGQFFKIHVVTSMMLGEPLTKEHDVNLVSTRSTHTLIGQPVTVEDDLNLVVTTEITVSLNRNATSDAPEPLC
jgi:hypothetical protein